MTLRPETRQVIGIALVLLLMCVVIAGVEEDFRSARNLTKVLLHSAVNCVLAVGMTFVILTGGIDLSVGSLMTLASAVMGVLLHDGFGGVLFSLAAALAYGTFAGVLQGTVIVRWAVPPFICTLGMMMAARGMAEAVSEETIHGLPEQALWLGGGSVGTLVKAAPGASGGDLLLPVPVVISLALVAVAHVVLTQTTFGRHVVAVGANEEAARLAGVPVGWVKLSVYMICGATAALAGIIQTGRMHAASPLIGRGAELEAIAAVVIGGTSLMGGRGTVVGSLIGALMMGVLRNALTLKGKPDRIQQIVIGGVIVFAVVLDQVLRRRSRRR
ncbi:MAG: ABC transporter permease [Armatimonadota bacterium]